MITRKEAAQLIIHFRRSQRFIAEDHIEIQKILYESGFYKTCFIYSRRFASLYKSSSRSSDYMCWWYFGRSAYFEQKINEMKITFKQCFLCTPEEPKNSFLMDDFRRLGYNISKVFAEVFHDFNSDGKAIDSAWIAANNFDVEPIDNDAIKLRQIGGDILNLNHFLKTSGNAPPMMYSRMSRVSIRRRGKFCAFYKGEKLINEFCFPYPELFQIESLKQKLNINKTCVPLVGPAIYIADEFSANNYAHWIVDQLPRLIFFLKQYDFPFVNILAYDPLPPYVRESIELLLGDNYNLIDMRHLSDVFVDDLFILNGTVDPASHPAYYCNAKLISEVADTIQQRLPSSGFENKKIYISRQKSRRKIINFNEVESFLIQMGFESVYLEDLDFVTQASVFNNASCIFSVHGAGLANLIFAKPTCRVFEYFPNSFGTAAFVKIGVVKGMDYLTARNTESNLPNDIGISEDVFVDMNLLTNWCSFL